MKQLYSFLFERDTDLEIKETKYINTDCYA